jgi:hypothetical protein
MRTFELKLVITTLNDDTDIESFIEGIQSSVYDGLDDGEELESIEGQELNPKIYISNDE